jgi:hypothetical protein
MIGFDNRLNIITLNTLLWPDAPEQDIFAESTVKP